MFNFAALLTKFKIGSIGKRIAKYVFKNHVVPILHKEIDKFADRVVKSPKNSVNLLDVQDVADIAKQTFIDELMEEDEF